MIVAIRIEGGIVQSATVLEDGDYKVRGVVVIDYDIDGMDPDDLTDVPQGGGTMEEAYVNEVSMENWNEIPELVEWLAKEYAPRIRHYLGPTGDLMATGRK